MPPERETMPTCPGLNQARADSALPPIIPRIPPRPGERVDASHIHSYWQEHVPLVNAGVDGFWPDEGDWFDLFERIKRHQLYHQGPLSTRPNVRPWSLHRNGHPGIAQWGGWVWSGDTETSWKTLEAQIAVGLNHSLSVAPYWGSDIGGFYPNNEFTGELYARWFQFGAFCGSFRSHGRVWWLRLPWGWNMGSIPVSELRGYTGGAADPDPAELHNTQVEPIVRKYLELRYRLLPYTYTIARECTDTGLPLMRALWLHHYDDPQAVVRGDQFLWGRDLLVSPVVEKGATRRRLYLPRGTWFDFWTEERLDGGREISRAVDLETMPLHVRAGAIVPFGPVKQYVDEPVDAPLSVVVYPGADGIFLLYEDDGRSFAYRKGAWMGLEMAWRDRDRRF